MGSWAFRLHPTPLSCDKVANEHWSFSRIVSLRVLLQPIRQQGPLMTRTSTVITSQHRALCAALIIYTLSYSANAAIFYEVSTPSEEAISEVSELADATVYDFFATTESDILLIAFDKLQTDANASMFNHRMDTEETDSDPPLDALIDLYPALAYDSYATTPGDTSEVDVGNAAGLTRDLQGASDVDDDDELILFDTSDDGPQNMFQFARFTLVGGDFIGFDGRISTATPPGVDEPIRTTFDVSGRGMNLTGATLVPEPSFGVLTPFIGMLLLGAARRKQ